MNAHHHSLIGISGRKRHGKDTFYKLALAPRLYERYAFANPLKAFALADRIYQVTLPQATAEQARDSLTRLLATDPAGRVDPELLNQKLATLREIFYQYLGEEKGPESRRHLQLFGTEVVRTMVDPSFWAAIVLDAARRHIPEGERIAVADTRFTNEAWAVQGQRDKLLTYYDEVEARGEAFDPRIRWQVTHHWSDQHPHDPTLHGLLPPDGVGVVVKIIRPELMVVGEDPSLSNHASELSIDQVEEDHLLTNRTIPQLHADANELVDTFQLDTPWLKAA